MNAIVAALNKKGEDCTETVITMLKAFTHSKVEAFGIASPTVIETEKSIEKLQSKQLNSSVTTGYIFSKTLPQDIPQAVKLKADATLVFNGRLYPANLKLSSVKWAAKKFKKELEEAAENFIRESHGDFTFFISKPGRLLAGRDSLGVQPLYYGENEVLIALASERKALWKIGLKKTYSFPPGNLALIDENGLKFKPVKKLANPKIVQISIETAVRKLQNILLQSVRERVIGLEKVAVAFSGGLDSSLLAFLTNKVGTNVNLVSVSLENQSEIEYVKKAAEALKLPLHTRLFKEEDVEKIIPKVLWLIEEADPIKLSIGIPFYWTAETAAKLGFKVLLAGQGADELFAGYKRYLNIYSNYGAKKAQEAVITDILKLYEKNFERDFKICNFHNVELRLPFASHELVKFAISLPLKLKIQSSNDTLRKHILREAAKKFGFPQFIVDKPKRAIQYATGVSKVIEKLAKKEKLSVKGYVEKIFRRSYSYL